MEKSSEKKKSKEDNKKKARIAICILILGVVALIIGLILLMRGSTTTTGEYPEDVKQASLICRANNFSYPIFTYDNSVKKETEVKVIFGVKEFSSISLTQTMFYNDKDDVTASEAFSHADMNKSFGRDSLGADALGVSYARLEDRMKMSLYVNASKIDVVTAKYFLIDRYSDYTLPRTLAELKKNYENKGFSCSTSE